LLFAPLLFVSICTAQSSIKPEWAVFSSSLKWESPPPELHSKIKSARARILVFFPSGEYGEVYCLLIRQGAVVYGIITLKTYPRHRLWSASSALQHAQNAAMQSKTIRRVVINFLLGYALGFSASTYRDQA